MPKIPFTTACLPLFDGVQKLLTCTIRVTSKIIIDSESVFPQFYIHIYLRGGTERNALLVKAIVISEVLSNSFLALWVSQLLFYTQGHFAHMDVCAPPECSAHGGQYQILRNWSHRRL